MRSLPRPKDDPGDVFRTCISNVRDAGLKARLVAIEPEVISAAGVYSVKAEAAQLHTLIQSDNVAGMVTSDEMSDVYANRLAKQGSPGRSVYDRILAAPRHGICPLCGVRRVKTVDHHLPKTRYPTLAVTPTNLVPACSDCNKDKSNVAPTCEEEQTIHPYFDDLGGERWLFAEVVAVSPPAARFTVRPPSSWSTITAKRVSYHFRKLGLGSLYSIQAAEELANMEFRLQSLFAARGPHAVRHELLDRFESCAHAFVNSWQTALYAALADSDWYCNGGFALRESAHHF